MLKKIKIKRWIVKTILQSNIKAIIQTRGETWSQRVTTYDTIKLCSRWQERCGMRTAEWERLSSAQCLSCIWLLVSPWLQHARPPCPSPTPRACSNSWPSCRWCHPSIRLFANEWALRIRWPKYWSFSFSSSPSNEYSGLISFRIVWLDLFAVQGILKRSAKMYIY